MKKYAIVAIAILVSSCSDDVTTVVSDNNHLTKTQHIISYGQSLSLGERATLDWPVDLGIPNDYAPVGFMFDGGVRSTDMTSLVPYAESTNQLDMTAWNIGTPGETPLYGALLQLRDLPGVRLGSAAGRGGTAISDLGPGSDPYTRLLNQVYEGYTLSGGDYSVPAIIWMQGESDVGNMQYATKLELLFQYINADIHDITGQYVPVQFFICTTSVPEIAIQQREVAAKDPNVHIACDDNDFPKSDGLHLTSQGSRDAGIALGKSIKLVMTNMMESQ